MIVPIAINKTITIIKDCIAKGEIVSDKIDGPIPVVIRYGVGDKDGSEKAEAIASEKVKKIKEIIGF